MRTFLRAVFLFPVIALFTSVNGQDTLVDITSRPGTNSDLQVLIRPTATFEGFFSSLVFTLRWDASTDAHLGTTQIAFPMNAITTVYKSGGEVDDNGYRYQVFVGFGISALTEIPTQWEGGVEQVLCTLPVTGQAAFTIVDDSWTGTHNANFYISLGGKNSTGEIYDTSTEIVEGSALAGNISVQPNPAEDMATLTAHVEAGTAVDLELVNAAGQRVWGEHITNAPAVLRRSLDLTRVERGVYMLRLTNGGEVRAQRVVKR